MFLLASTTNEKPYNIMFEHRPKYLYVAVQCETTNYAIAKRYWTEILAMQTRRRYQNVLIDKDIVNSMPLYDVVMLVAEIAHSGCHDVKLAIYDRNYDPDRCALEEMIGTNRGLKVRMCKTFEEAEHWLSMSHIPVMSATASRAPKFAV